MSSIPPHELPSYISTCLAEGFSQEEIASALSVSPAYISQLCTKHQLCVPAQQQFANIDQLYQEVELSALQALKRTLGTIGDPMKLARIAQTMNATKRRSLSAHPSENKPTTVVQLNLPATAAAQFVFNGSSEAVAWKQGDQTHQLITCTTTQLDNMAAQFAAKPVLLPVMEDGL